MSIMSLNELSGNNRNVNNYPLKFNSNQILIHKHQIPKLKKNSGFFEVFIDKDFSDSNQYFNKDGNYILKKEILPEEIYYYDKESNTEYLISRDDVFKVLPEILYEGKTGNPVLAGLVRDFFMFNKNVNFFNPTLPIPEHIKKANGYYTASPGKKELQKSRRRERELERLERLEELGLNYELLNKKTRKEQLTALKKQLQQLNRNNAELLAEEAFGNNSKVALVVSENEKAKKTYKKYPKSGVRPSKTSRKTLRYRGKDKRRTQRRNMARGRKTMKRRVNGNNNNNNNYGNEEVNNNGNYNQMFENEYNNNNNNND